MNLKYDSQRIAARRTYYPKPRTYPLILTLILDP